MTNSSFQSSESPVPESSLANSSSWRWLMPFARLVLLLLIMLAWFQRSLIYHPSRSKPLPASESGLSQAAVDLKVTTHDGLTLNGWLSLANQKKTAKRADLQKLMAQGRPLVILFPGNAGNRTNRVHMLRTFGLMGVDAMIYDYRGYAENPGSPTEASLIRDARAIWNHATQDLGVPARRIVLYGESLGGGSAVRLAADLCKEGIEPGGLIVQSTFNSLVDAGRHHFPILPVGLILIDRFESDRHVAGVTCPILQIHGARDRIVPLSLGQKLFDATPAKSSNGTAKRFIILPNADHNDVYGQDRQLLVDAIKFFVKEISKQTHP